jgi:hypothetical protein
MVGHDGTDGYVYSIGAADNTPTTTITSGDTVYTLIV